MTSKALVLLSGGQDSTTCLFWALQYGFDEVHAVAFDYGQRHAVELDAARKIASNAAVPLEVISVPDVLVGASPLVSGASLAQYDGFDSLPSGLEATFVPLRNQLFITLAANRAYALGATNLVTGVCQADNGGYPDCTQAFIDSIGHAINTGAFTGRDGAPTRMTIHTPLMNLTKAETVDMALRIDGCYAALAHSHTAYDGAFPPNGNDHATLLRERGFAEAGVPDPLVLRAISEGLETKKLNRRLYSKKNIAKFSKIAGLSS